MRHQSLKRTYHTQGRIQGGRQDLRTPLTDSGGGRLKISD